MLLELEDSEDAEDRDRGFSQLASTGLNWQHRLGVTDRVNLRYMDLTALKKTLKLLCIKHPLLLIDVLSLLMEMGIQRRENCLQFQAGDPAIAVRRCLPRGKRCAVGKFLRTANLN